MSPYRKILKYIPTFDSGAAAFLCVAVNVLIRWMNSFVLEGIFLRYLITMESQSMPFVSNCCSTANADLLAHIFTNYICYIFGLHTFVFNFPTCIIVWRKNFLPLQLQYLGSNFTADVFFALCVQCGFFRRSRYEDSVPRYHAVRIRKEERQIKDGKSQDLDTKQWLTKWNENESYS